MKAVNIKWDTEGYNVKEDMVADFLSDTFGFCVFGFQITKNERSLQQLIFLCGLFCKHMV